MHSGHENVFPLDRTTLSAAEQNGQPITEPSCGTVTAATSTPSTSGAASPNYEVETSGRPAHVDIPKADFEKYKAQLSQIGDLGSVTYTPPPPPFPPSGLTATVQ